MGIFNESLNTILLVNKKNIKNVIIFIIAFGVLYPFIDSLIIKPIQIQQELSIFKDIKTLDKVESYSEVQKQLYDDINNKIEKYLSTNSLSFDIKQAYKDDPWKFYSATIIWILCFFALLFQKLKLIQKVGSLIVVVLFIIGIGVIGLLLPDIYSPWINYIGFPTLQIIFLISLLDIKTKKKEV